MKKYFTRKEIEKMLPIFDRISFSHWTLVARIDPARKCIVNGHGTYFYTRNQIKRLESKIRSRHPELFAEQPQSTECADKPSAV